MKGRACFILTITTFSIGAYAATQLPDIACPVGHFSATEDQLILVDGTSCPAGYMAVGGDAPTSCLVANPDGVCVMYAPAGTTYTDTSGHSFEFTQACPLE